MRHYEPADVKQHFQTAREILFNRFGLPKLNQRVRTPVNDTGRSDDEIRENVFDELRSEPTIDAAAIDVHVKNGVVTLTGSTDGVGDKWLIEAAARRVPELKVLTVELAVIMPDPGMRSDDDIRRDCEHVLGSTVPGANHAIKVMVTSGWVTLSGSVDWGYERWSAEEIVSRLMGVNGVNGQIKARPFAVPTMPEPVFKAGSSRESEPYI